MKPSTGYFVLITVTLSLAVIGCDSSAENSADESATSYSENGPFVAEDPYQLIREAGWTSTPGVDGPTDIPVDQDATLLDSSTPASLRIGIWGNLCYPHVLITVAQGPPEVELLLQIGEPILEEGIQCPELLTTHEFELVLDQDINLNQLTLTATNLASG